MAPDYALVFSDGMNRILGLPKDAPVLFSEILNILSETDRPRMQGLIDRCFATGEGFALDFPAITVDGRAIHTHIVAEAECNRYGHVVAINGGLQDVTNIKKTEAESQKISARLYSTLESITDSLLVIDTDWRLTYMNPAAERILQRTRQELEGRYIWDEFETVPGFPVRTLCERAAETGQTQSADIYYEPLDIWTSVRAYPSADGISFYFQDISKQRVLEEKLQRAQRLEAVGHLTGGVAHDFNNLLTVIIGNVEVVIDSLPDGSHLQKPALAALEAAERGTEMTSQLLAFSRKQVLKPQPVNLGDLIESTTSMLNRLLGEHIEVQLLKAPDLWTTEVDPTQFGNAIINLCVNARDAMPDGGQLLIETTNFIVEEAPDPMGEEGEEITPGDYVMVSVSDTGSGMSPEVVKKAFEPFYTTKSVGKGSGLGLSMAYGLVKQSGGHIRIYSEVGIGTSIKIYLPRVSMGSVDHRREQPMTPDIVGGTESILVVEDDDMVRQYVIAQLNSMGYTIKTAANGKEALDLLRQGGEFDLLFTDVVLPGGLNGRQLADQATAMRPNIKVLFTSGYTQDTMIHHGRLDAGVTLLSKPYRRSDLAAKIRYVLDAAS